MAVEVGDILQITDVQTYLTQQMLNVYFYRVTALEPLVDYADIAEGFDNVVREAVVDIQLPAVSHTVIVVKNLTNGIDIWEQVDTRPGESAGTGSGPSYVALGFRLVRSTGLTRHGAKRYGGIPETFIEGNGIASGITGQIGAVETALGADIARVGTVDHDFTAEPVIVGRFPLGDPNVGELDLATINPVAAGQFIRPTSQATRKVGRGN